MDRKPKILVVGSFVMDQIATTEVVPREGQTVLGKAFHKAPGGKGANQAVQAARLGAEVTMVGKLGRDANGGEMLKTCVDAGIDVSHVLYDNDTASGCAVIILQERPGEAVQNRILVIPGANMTLTVEEAAFLKDTICLYDMVILQNEIPMEVNLAVAGYAYEAGVPVMLNSAPSAVLLPELYRYLTYICPNETEIEDMTGIHISHTKEGVDLEAARRAAQQLLERGVKNVLITLGSAGAFLVNEREEIYSPSADGIEVTDPTAAGDSFVGAFCVGLCLGWDWKKVMVFANHTAGLTVTKMGAMPSLPTLEAVEEELKKEALPDRKEIAMFNGLNMNMGNLYRLSDARTRSICPENFTGEKGRGGSCEWENGSAKMAARDLGTGWKVNPYIKLQPGETFTIAQIEGPGCIQHIWLTPTGKWRNTILRMYWDDNENPSVETPVGDFFCAGWNEYHQVSSLAVCVNPGSAFNCYWPMPFRKKCKMTLENRAEDPVTMYYQIDYTLTEVPEDAAYFHAQFRRVNPLPYKSVYTILDGVKGKGHYVGTYMAWGVNNNGWWGEGEIKFYMDGDTDYPTICGTGTEDYFCGSYNFENPHTHDGYVSFTTPYSGFHEIRRNEIYTCQKRFGMYRFHIMDPIRFEKELKVTIQALGWREGKRYLPMQDDISSVAFWYQDGEAAKFPELPDKDYLEII